MRKEAREVLRKSASWEVSQIILVNQYHVDKQPKGDMTEGICSTQGGYEKVMKM
jgi:hypothetical protein